ncbi:glycosyl transferase family protein [Calothrix sp. NIES-4101]|nr:glycosyl transferase family protein [Calothrix sp. NIES-4101]
MTKKWFQIGLVGVFLLALALRFWGLERFNTLVFDEVYYAKFGNNYLTGVPFFDGHPPLGKLIIAVGIWIGKHVPWWDDTVNGLTGTLMSPLAYRWINAFSGAFIPLLIAGIAYQLSHRRTFALIAGLFAACDGIFIVEARYALINQYIVIFGLLAHLLLLIALNHKQQRNLCLALAGVSFGASIGTKWNGVFYLAGAYGLWIVAWLIRGLQNSKFAVPETNLSFPNEVLVADTPLTRPQLIFMWKNKQRHEGVNDNKPSPLENLTQINIFQIIVFLAIMPMIIYSIIWIPHLRLDTKYNFIEVHKQIFGFHERMGGNNVSVHPYCAAWYKWPLMIRPMAYYYQTAQTFQEPLPVMGPPLPPGAGKVIYDVHAMGNPFLWWLGVAALVILFGMLVSTLMIPSINIKRFVFPDKITPETWIAIYLILNYAANLLPWIKVTRCLFIYHYMTGVVFAFMAIAWVVDQCLHSYRLSFRATGVSATFLIIGGLIWWLPIYLGLPLTNEGYRPLRMWFNSWI